MVQRCLLPGDTVSMHNALSSNSTQRLGDESATVQVVRDLNIAISLASSTSGGHGAGLSSALYLLTAATNDAGVEFALTISPGDEKRCSMTLAGAQLPLECSPPDSWCRDPLVLKNKYDNRTQTISFFPVSGAIVLLEAWYDGMQVECREPYLLEVEMCSPSLVFQTKGPEGSVFFVRSDPSASYLALYSVAVNYTSVNASTSYFVQALEVEQGFSNVLALHLAGFFHSNRLVYWTGGSLQQLMLDNYLTEELAEVACSTTPELRNAGGNRIAILCSGSESATYYDYNSDSVTTDLYASSGYPVFCPSLHTLFSVYQQLSRVDYTTSEATLMSAWLPGNSFITGYCLVTAVPPVFLAVDAEVGVWAVDVSSNTSYQPLPGRCQEPGSWPGEAPGEPWLCQEVLTVVRSFVVVKEGVGLVVLDSARELVSVLEVRGSTTIATVIEVQERGGVPEHLPVVAIAAPVAAAVLAALLLVAGVTLSLCFIRW